MKSSGSREGDLPRRTEQLSGKVALQLALGYLGISMAWILGSDALLNAVVSDVRTLAMLQTLKGAAFMLLTAVLLYCWTRQRLREFVRAQEAAEASSRRFAHLAQVAPVGILIADCDGQCTYVNDRFAEIKGVPPQEAKGIGWQRTIHPDDRVLIQKLWEELGRTGAETEVEYRVKLEDESIRCVWGRAVAERGADGEITGFIATCLDVTESRRAEEALRRSEARFRRLAEAGLIGILVGNFDGSVSYANPAFLRMIGWTAEEIAAGKLRWPDVTPAEWAAADRRAMDQVRARGVSEPFEKEFLRRDGSRVVTVIGLAQIEGSTPGECICFVLDITARKRAERELANSRAQLRALATRLSSVLEDERGRLARELHDEFGSTLTSLKMSLTALDRRLARTLSPEVAQPLRTRVEESVSAVDSMAQNVRQICMDLRPGVLDQLGLAPAIEWQANEFQSRSGIECHIDRPEAIAVEPEKAIGLFRIFQEILTNVGRHADASNVGVTLTDGGGELTLEVWDDGRGIDMDTVARSGGLGLVGMQERALAMGGEVSFSAPPEGGTRVTVRIPTGPHFSVPARTDMALTS